jgi:hypothetical protein
LGCQYRELCGHGPTVPFLPFALFLPQALTMAVKQHFKEKLLDPSSEGAL